MVAPTRFVVRKSERHFREGAETLPYMIVRVLRQLRNVEGAVPYMDCTKGGRFFASLRMTVLREGAETLPYEIVRILFHFLFDGFKAGAEVF